MALIDRFNDPASADEQRPTYTIRYSREGGGGLSPDAPLRRTPCEAEADYWTYFLESFTLQDHIGGWEHGREAGFTLIVQGDDVAETALHVLRGEARTAVPLQWVHVEKAQPQVRYIDVKG